MMLLKLKEAVSWVAEILEVGILKFIDINESNQQAKDERGTCSE